MTQCFSIEIIPDIAFEGEEEFQLHIVPSEQPIERVEISLGTANVTIIDYNGE